MPISEAPLVLLEEVDKELYVREPILALAAEAAPFAYEHGCIESVLSSDVFLKYSSGSVVARILILRSIDHEIVAVRSEAEVLLALAVDFYRGSRARDAGVRPIAVLNDEYALVCDLADSGRNFVDKRRILLDIELSDIFVSGFARDILEDISGYLLEIFDLVASLLVEEIADELDGKIAVGKVDVDENRELAVKYGVMSIPTVIYFKNGEEVARLIGVQSREKLLETANKLL